MRKYTYLCDNCRCEIGDHVHLNVKSMNIKVAVPPTLNVDIERWTSETLVQGPEMQFCNLKCLGAFLAKNRDRLGRQLKGENA